MKSSTFRPNRDDSHWHWAWLLNTEASLPVCHGGLSKFLQWEKGGWVLLRSFHHQTDGSQTLLLCACLCVFPICFQGWGPVWWRRPGPCRGPFGFCVCTASMGDGNEAEDCWTFPPHWQHVSPICYSVVEKTKRERARAHNIFCHCFPLSDRRRSLLQRRDNVNYNILVLLHLHILSSELFCISNIFLSQSASDTVR